MNLNTGSAEIQQMHQRAAQWLSDEGLSDEALAHWLDIRNDLSAARLVERGLKLQLNQDNRLGISRRLALFPPDFIENRPVLLLMQAWVAHFDLRITLVKRLAEKVQMMLDGILASDNEIQAEDGKLVGFEEINPILVLNQVRVLKSMICFLTNQSGAGAALARQALAYIPPDWAFLRGLAMFYLGLCFTWVYVYRLRARGKRQYKF